MKCTNCGLPLSPSRSVCSRCGTPREGKQSKVAVSSSLLPVGAFSSRAHQGRAGDEQRQSGSAIHNSATQWDAPGIAFAQTQLGQQQPSVNSNQQTPSEEHVPDRRPPDATMPFPRKLVTSPRVGFTVAGLCVFIAGLLLAFVYFMTSSSSLVSSQTTTGSLTSPPTKLQSTDTPIATRTSPSPTATSTGAFPGQQYIDNAQTAGTINTATAQPIQVASSFKVNQRIYVTLNVHNAGRSGAMCFHWLLNDKEIAKIYGLPLAANVPTAYSYVSYESPGAGTVEIYWASTPACTDSQLAQKVSFTVS